MKKVVIDANVVIRFLVKDVASQYQQAADLFSQIKNKKITGHLPLLVIAEVIWILERYYQVGRAEYLPKLAAILSFEKILTVGIAKRDCLELFSDLAAHPQIDLTDLYIALYARKNQLQPVSFERDLMKLGLFTYAFKKGKSSE